MLIRPTRRGPCTGSLKIAVVTSWPSHEMRRGEPTLTERSRIAMRGTLSPADHQLAGRLTRLHHPVRLGDLLEGEHARRPRLVDAGLHLLDDLLERDRRQRKGFAAHLEAPEEAELHPTRQLKRRLEAVHRAE